MMKYSFSPALVSLLLGMALLFSSAPGVEAQSSRHRKKTPVEDTDDEKSSPTPTPSPTPRKRSAKTDESSPSPSPAPKSEAGSQSKEADKPSSADEAAPSKSDAKPGTHAPGTAATSSIEASELEGFDTLPEPVRQLLSAALDLTKRNLTYAYGSADPASGGMDCSGTMYYLLKQRGFDNVPRQASEQYAWVRKQSQFYAVLSKKQDASELNEMRPGDLLFWTGTYNVDRDPPVTHVMIYLGRRKKDGHRIMFGASDGRPYDGQRRNGVSVFDFKMPAARSGDAADAATAAAPDHAPDFAGYGPVPGMVDLSDAAKRQTAAAHPSPTPATAKETNQDDDSSTPPAKPKRTRSSKRSGS